MSISEKKVFTEAEKARTERNRQKALHLRQAKLVAHPYKKIDTNAGENAIIKVQGTKFIDSGGGFLIEEPTIKDNKNKIEGSVSSSQSSTTSSGPSNLSTTYKDCLECNEKFLESYLFKHFDYYVCDQCYDREDKHTLITKTEAKQVYLLKDCDLDKREPHLKFITRKNPHHANWGDMKLYLHLQIEKRALEVWGSEEELSKQLEKRDEQREISKIKRYNKNLKQLRMDVRSSLYDKTTAINHTHSFGPDTYNEDDDTYTHACLTCQYSETYEKM